MNIGMSFTSSNGLGIRFPSSLNKTITFKLGRGMLVEDIA